jgi:hypothetical protein
MRAEDPSQNVVVFELLINQRLEQITDAGETKANDCVQQAWDRVRSRIGAVATDVKEIWSEWEPSAEDLAFLAVTFPGVQLTYSFERPTPDRWDAAMESARRTLREALDESSQSKR